MALFVPCKDFKVPDVELVYKPLDIQFQIWYNRYIGMRKHRQDRQEGETKMEKTFTGKIKGIDAELTITNHRYDEFMVTFRAMGQVERSKVAVERKSRRPISREDYVRAFEFLDSFETTLKAFLPARGSGRILIDDYLGGGELKFQ